MAIEATINPKLPTWSGDWLQWPDYKLSVELEADATSKDDLSRLAPKLVRNLTGKAWETAVGLEREKLKSEDGVNYLLSYLEEKRGRQKVDVLGDALGVYFQKSEIVRKDGEVWNDFEARHAAKVRDINKALVAVGAKGDTPSEIWGWFLLHQFVRLEPSDVATVKSFAKNYQLDEVCRAMRQLWGGDSLALRDQERKKAKNNVKVLMNEPNTPDDNGIWLGSPDLDGEEVNHEDDPDLTEDEISVLFDEACEALHEDPTNPVVLANFQEMKKLKYTEARKALDRSRTARGFFPNSTRSSTSMNSRTRKPPPFDGLCMRCGKHGHKARDCLQKAAPSNSRREPAAGKIGFVGYLQDANQALVNDADTIMDTESAMVFEEDLDFLYQESHPIHVAVACEKGAENSEGPGFIGSTQETTRDKAIIDCGASESIVGANMLQDFCDTLHELGFDPKSEVTVDRQVKKSFIFGNNETSSSLGLAKVNTGMCGTEQSVDLHVVEGSTPFLLSSKWLWEQEATINFKTGKALFPKLSDNQVQLERAPTFHLLLPLTAFEGNGKLINELLVTDDDQDVSILKLQSAPPEKTTLSEGVAGQQPIMLLAKKNMMVDLNNHLALMKDRSAFLGLVDACQETHAFDECFHEAGFFRKLDLFQWLEGQGIRVQAIAAEAPWQLGKHSKHLETVKENASLLALETAADVDVEETFDDKNRHPEVESSENLTQNYREMDLKQLGEMEQKHGKYSGVKLVDIVEKKEDFTYLRWLVEHHPKNPKFLALLIYLERHELVASQQAKTAEPKSVKKPGETLIPMSSQSGSPYPAGNQDSMLKIEILEKRMQEMHSEMQTMFQTILELKDHNRQIQEAVMVLSNHVAGHQNRIQHLEDTAVLPSDFEPEETPIPVNYMVENSEMIEITMIVAPRDVHNQRRNGVQEWVLNQKPKKNAEVKLKTLNEEEKAEFRVAMRSEIDSFLEREAIAIASRHGIDPQKLLNMRWVLTYKPITDEQGESAQEEQITFCGCEITQDSHFSICLGQERYALGINEICVSPQRKKDPQAKANIEEKKQLRATLGALSWRATQTCPWLAASVSVLQGKQNDPSIEDLLEANKLIRMQRQFCEMPLRFSSQIQEPVLVSYSDASWSCRADGSSQGGQLTVLADRKFLDGHRSEFSLVSWQSRKLGRVARSSTSAEVQMASNTTDNHEFLKQVILEWFNKEKFEPHQVDAAMRQIPSVLILDCKNLYDAMCRIQSSGLQLEERRTAIDVLSIRERTLETGIQVRWTDSDQQLADGLSKPQKFDHLLDLLKQ
ncbi:unnamed protein product, partial [Cladocopium goreaui]